MSHGLFKRIVCSGRKIFLTVLLFALTACATEKPSGVVEAVATPISDLNIIRAKIPPALLEAHDDPFAVPGEQPCAALEDAITDLDHALGPNGNGNGSVIGNGNGSGNGEQNGKEGDSSLVDKGTSKAGEATVDALRRTAEGLVPFREWVRKLSGAERHSKLVADSVAAGLIRRAYLKGIKVGRNCK